MERNTDWVLGWLILISRHVYSASTSPGKVIKINLSDFSRVGAVEFQMGQNEPVSAVVSGNHAYFG
jgi:hypothetical protein